MSRPATSRLKVNPQLGRRPSLEFRPVTELSVDPSYQRTIETGTSQALIRRIAQFWDWGLCQPLTVAKRDDGSLMVVDGQHRLEAARLRGDIYDLPCVITGYANAGDEAAAFVALNQQRRPLSPLDLFRAAVAAEDEEACAILQLIRDSGLSLAPHTNPTAWKPGMVANVPGIREVYRSAGSEVTRMALDALAQAFAGEVLRYAGTIFAGVGGFIVSARRAQVAVTLPALVKALERRPQASLAKLIQIEAAATGDGRRRAAATVIGRLFHNSPIETAAPAMRTLATDQDGKAWCGQCDRRVTVGQATACRDRFCSLKAAA